MFDPNLCVELSTLLVQLAQLYILIKMTIP